MRGRRGTSGGGSERLVSLRERHDVGIVRPYLFRETPFYAGKQLADPQGFEQILVGLKASWLQAEPMPGDNQRFDPSGNGLIGNSKAASVGQVYVGDDEIVEL
jgi:hypothetical protein